MADGEGAVSAERTDLRYYIETWGCQMNVHDSEKLSGTLSSIGYEPCASPEAADLVLLNTCAIREKAAEKVFSELGRLRKLKRRKPSMLIGLAGCVASLKAESVFKRAPHVDLVMGPRGILNLPIMLEAARARRRAIDVVHHQESILYPWERAKRSGGPRAYVTVVEGCNKACTFCIVPRTRGPEASRTVEHVLREVRALAGGGYKEIEFLGQTVNAYRDPKGRKLSDLLSLADRIEGVRRLRFTTSHPLHMTDDLMGTMGSLAHLVRHLHLPAQSGSDEVLSRMKRGYTLAGYLERVRILRRIMPDLSLSTDIIVGFPGETEGDFEATLGLIEEVGYDMVYSFLYSPRPGTEAAGWDDGVSFEQKAERLSRLQARQEEIQSGRLSAWVGREVEVLVEGPAKTGKGLLMGRSLHGQIVNFPGGIWKVGDLVPVVVEESGSHSLKGIARSRHS
jgi:tRNA-2-methylthio-N6-dimethylallyladenosine synthase